MNLYEITEEMRDLFEQIDPETGEAPEGLADRIMDLNLSFEQKLVGYIAWIKNMEADIYALIDAKTKIHNKIISANRTVEYAKFCVKDALEATNTRKFSTAIHSAWIQENGGIIPVIMDEAIDIAKVPDRFVKVERKLDMDAIRDAMEAGEKLPFAALGKRGEHLRIS